MSAPGLPASVRGIAARGLGALRTLLPRASDYAGARRTWRGDLVAGLTVGIVALPLALAFGVSSGVGAEAGLVTAIVAGLVAAVFGGSHVQVSGPTGAMVVVLAPIVASHGAGAVALLSVMAGIILVALGGSRLGRAVAYIPWPVVEGFTLGIGVIIFLQQVPLAVSAHVAPGQNTAVAAAAAVAAAPWPRAAASLGVVVLVAATTLLVPRIHRALPASLLAILVASLGAGLLGLDDAERIGALPSSLPAPALPGFALSDLPSLAGPAVAVATLAAIESLLSARVASGLTGPDGRTTGPYNPDRELVGQGLASLAAGLFGGMPATGAIARTAVNVRSGGRSRMAAVAHALVLLGVVYLTAPLVAQIPLAALAGVLMVTAGRMVSVRTARRILGSTRQDAVAFVLTAVVTVAFDLIVAIQIGLVAAALLTLRQFAKLGSVRREPIPGPAHDGDEHIAVFRLDGLMFFGAAERVLEEVTRTSSADGVEVVVLRLSQLRYLDATGAQTLVEAIRTLEARGVTVLLKGVQENHLELVRRVGVIAELRHHRHLFDSLDEAVEHARSHVRRARLPSATA
ncbi:SulP family sulfate permease [Sinomonas atrocyanea]|uniref:SulP family inorganic anion transporter n=1 Tax=Sinomonas atrocyanea TaxID=37927 RepID=UPI002784F96A|nr:SulP family inorganic anion transporter [Sinomonas atrocyanea]MDP9884710.1 SulP family sulfate permease [Sinomonas atrocyanea]